MQHSHTLFFPEVNICCNKWKKLVYAKSIIIITIFILVIMYVM